MMGMVFDLSAELQRKGKLKEFQRTGRLDEEGEEEAESKGGVGMVENGGMKPSEENGKNKEDGTEVSESGEVSGPKGSENAQAEGEMTKSGNDVGDEHAANDGSAEKQHGGDGEAEHADNGGTEPPKEDVIESKDAEADIIVKGVEGTESEEARGTFKTAMLDMFTRFEVNVLVYLFFFMYVTHTCLQGITPLFAELMLKWDETKISLVYTAWGVEIMLVLIVIWIVAPYVPDRVILIWAVFGGTLASVSLVVLTYSEPESPLCYYSFLITIFLGGIGIAITVVVGRSLISKHTLPENQCLVHAILTSLNRMAGLTGPIFGSSLYTNKIFMGYLIGGMQFIGLVLLLIVYKRL
jgi:hypothetical protein